MKNADEIREFAEEKYVASARERGANRFSIRTGDIVRDLGLVGRAPAVCSALKSRRFCERNNLRLVEATGPKSGQSTTVVYTYEFIETKSAATQREDPWIRLRGALKDVFAELGGGEAYLQDERNKFYAPREGK